MTLSDIQALIKSRAKQHCFNEELQAVLLATTFPELIEAGIPIFEWAYQSGVVDDVLLEEFTEADLNPLGIYTKGTVTITNPTKEIFILKDTAATINVDSTNQASVVAMGKGTATINVSGNAYCKVSANDKCNLTIVVSNNAILNLDARDQSFQKITQNDASSLNIESKGRSSIDLEINDTSVAIANLFQHSNMVYTLFDTGELVPHVFNNSTLHQNIPGV